MTFGFESRQHQMRVLYRALFPPHHSCYPFFIVFALPSSCIIYHNISAHYRCKQFDPLMNNRIYLLNPLNPELNPICYLLALLVAHHFLHYSRISVKLLTFRVLMSYIYIYMYMEHPFLMFLNHTQRRSTVGRTLLDE